MKPAGQERETRILDRLALVCVKSCLHVIGKTFFSGDHVASRGHVMSNEYKPQFVFVAISSSDPRSVSHWKRRALGVFHSILIPFYLLNFSNVVWRCCWEVGMISTIWPRHRPRSQAPCFARWRRQSYRELRTWLKKMGSRCWSYLL